MPGCRWYEFKTCNRGSSNYDQWPGRCRARVLLHAGGTAHRSTALLHQENPGNARQRIAYRPQAYEGGTELWLRPDWNANLRNDMTRCHTTGLSATRSWQ